MCIINKTIKRKDRRIEGGIEEGMKKKTFSISLTAHGKLQRATFGLQNHLVNKCFRTLISRF